MLFLYFHICKDQKMKKKCRFINHVVYVVSHQQMQQRLCHCISIRYVYLCWTWTCWSCLVKEMVCMLCFHVHLLRFGCVEMACYEVSKPPWIHQIFYQLMFACWLWCATHLNSGFETCFWKRALKIWDVLDVTVVEKQLSAIWNHTFKFIWRLQSPLHWQTANGGNRRMDFVSGVPR